MGRAVVAALLAVILTIIHIVCFVSSIGERVEPWTLDLWAALSTSQQPYDDVVILAIDEQSYGTLNVPLNQAWPRALQAKLLNRLSEAGVKRAVFDVLFLGPGPDPIADESFAEAIPKTLVVLGSDSVMRDQVSASGSFRLEEVLMPFEPFRKKAEAIALVGFPDDYGYVRRFLTGRTMMTKEIATLSEAAVGFAPGDGKARPGPRDFIKLYGPRGTIQTFSYSQAIDPEHPLPEQFLKNKVVFVGLILQTDTGPAQKDIFMTPYGRVFGTEVHASAALNLLHNDWTKRMPLWVEVAIIGVLTFLFGFLAFLLRPQWGLILVGALEVSWFISGYILYQNNIFTPGLLLVAVFMPLTLLLSTMYYYFVTRRAELKMQSAFQYYVSPEMAQEVSKSSSIGLGGEKIWATAMFTDIAGFTSITEDLPAERVSAMLNAYFTEVMDVVFQNRGTLIKFIGDAVFVIWGAPIKIDNHAELACKTAIAIQREVERFNKSERFPALHTRVGVHTGPMVVGNLGSEKRFDYTAIGDTVNLASRVEGINKYFGTKILITEATKKELGNLLPTLCVGSIQVAGKREAVDLYLISDEQIPDKIRSRWDEGLSAFRSRDWELAASIFHDLQDSTSIVSKAATLYIEQAAYFANHQPPPEWQGNITFSSK